MVFVRQSDLIYYEDLTAVGETDLGLILTLLAARVGLRPFIDWMFIDIDGLTTSPQIIVKFGTDVVKAITSGDYTLGRGGIGFPGPCIGNTGKSLTVTFLSTTGTGIVRGLVGYVSDKQGGTSIFTT